MYACVHFVCVSVESLHICKFVSYFLRLSKHLASLKGHFCVENLPLRTLSLTINVPRDHVVGATILFLQPPLPPNTSWRSLLRILFEESVQDLLHNYVLKNRLGLS